MLKTTYTLGGWFSFHIKNMGWENQTSGIVIVMRHKDFPEILINLNQVCDLLGKLIIT